MDSPLSKQGKLHLISRWEMTKCNGGTSGHLAVYIMCMYVSVLCYEECKNEQNPCIMTYVYEMNQLPL